MALADGEPAQVVGPADPVPLELVDLSGLEPGRRQAAADEFIRKAAAQQPGPAGRPLLRAWLLRLAGDEHMLLAAAPLAMLDDWSAGVLVRDLAALYRAEFSGREPALAAPTARFGDYVVWQRDRRPAAVPASVEEYWRGALAARGTSQFPADRPEPAAAGSASGAQIIRAGPELLAGCAS